MLAGVKLGRNVEVEDETVRIMIWKKLKKVCFILVLVRMGK
jgi:hypothetical protein